MKIHTKILTSLLLLISIFSCNLFQTEESNLVNVTIALDNSRTIMPSADIKEYKLYGNKTGETEELLGTYTNLSTAVLTLEKGTWEFKLEAIKNDDNLFGSNTLTDQVLGDSPVTLSFTITNSNTTSKGTVDITFNWPTTIPVAKYDLRFGTIAEPISIIYDEEVDIATNTFNYTNDTLDKGTYKISLYLQDENYKDLCIYTDIVQIECGLISKSTINLTEDDFNKKPIAPSNLQGTLSPSTELNVGKLLLTWSDNSNNEKKFRLDFSFSENDDFSPRIDFDGGTQTMIITQNRGSTIYFRLVASNSIGDSAPSNVIGPITFPYLVQFNLDGGSISEETTVPSQEIAPNGTISLPTNPTRDGYVFVGWFSAINGGGTEYTSSTQVSTNVTLYPKWLALNSVTQNDGVSGTTDTASLTLTFSTDPGAITVDDITLTGATKSTLTGTGATRTLTISNITVGNAENVTVTVNTLSKTVVVYRAPYVGMPFQGGIIAYFLQSGDPGYVSGETHGLIASTADLSTGIQWAHQHDIAIGATGTALGTGQGNTTTIVNNQGNVLSYAARLCYEYSTVEDGVTYDDWYLASKDELNKLYLNKAAVGGFTGVYYWSSSENNDSLALVQSLVTGGQGSHPKNINYPVRAVQSF
ncbi:DUF1566 domain-containing protein [Thiospirochaeta perfilievii]|uniref:DUF1566 domain-containing protein n=1 Tax=Thiospirochaeta perfilievii TaxID=252967 RepID=A0A5C1QBU9_9SPIO|nr:InlB B-repeat-containing protein [Thiospirochaeta perfilievii]QEN05555.1 DUF1566 domain-containing protein [Thiospirochaeta perfilievii]